MSIEKQAERAPVVHGLQAVDPAKRLQEATDECLREVNAVLVRYGAQVVSTPRFVPDGIGGFRLTISTEIVLKG